MYYITVLKQGYSVVTILFNTILTFRGLRLFFVVFFLFLQMLPPFPLLLPQSIVSRFVHPVLFATELATFPSPCATDRSHIAAQAHRSTATAVPNGFAVLRLMVVPSSITGTGTRSRQRRRRRELDRVQMTVMGCTTTRRHGKEVSTGRDGNVSIIISLIIIYILRTIIPLRSHILNRVRN